MQLKNWFGRILTSLLLSSSLSLPIWAATATVVGRISTPQGAAFNGQISFQLPFAGAVDTNCSFGSCLLVPSVKRYPVVNGAITPAPVLTRNGDVKPVGTYYRAYLYDSFGNNVAQSAFVIPVGAATFDIGAALQTTITTNNVSFINPGDTEGNNTWNGNNTFTGLTTFDGTVIFNSTVIFNTAITLFQDTNIAGGTITGTDTLHAPAGGPFAWNFPAHDGTFMAALTATSGSCANGKFNTTTGVLDLSTCAPLASPVFTGDPTGPTPSVGDNDNSLATTAFVHTAFGGSLVQKVRDATPCTTGSTGHDSCNDTLTWPLTMTDTNYTVVCSGMNPNIGSGGETAIGNVFSKSATQVVFVTQTEHDTRTAHFTQIDCIGIHD